jgi:hypothetical protein
MTEQQQKSELDKDEKEFGGIRDAYPIGKEYDDDDDDEDE